MCSPSAAISSQWIWLAGLLEGEGYFGATNPGGNRRKQLRVTLNMCDGDVVARAAEIVGSNTKIGFQTKKPDGWRPTYVVQWTGRDAERIMRAILPYMGERRSAAIRDALAQDCGHRKRTHCPHGHRFTDANTYINPSHGGRKCRTCIRERERNAGAK